jgi:hypothetical protein
MRPALTILSIAATLLGIAAIAFFLLTHAPKLAFRVVACLLLIDQATLTLLYLRLPIDVAPLQLALRIGSFAILVAGALLLVWCALPHEGPMEFAMFAVAIGMIALGVLTLRHLARASGAESH